MLAARGEYNVMIGHLSEVWDGLAQSLEGIIPAVARVNIQYKLALANSHSQVVAGLHLSQGAGVIVVVLPGYGWLFTSRLAWNEGL